MFRNLVVAALAVLALSSVGVGTAFAGETDPSPSPTPDPASKSLLSTGDILSKNHVQAPVCVLPEVLSHGKCVTAAEASAAATATRGYHPPRGSFAPCAPWQDRIGTACIDRRSGNHYGGHFYNDRFDGRYLLIDGFNQRLDVCAYNSYNDYAGHYGTYRGRVDSMFGNGSKWDSIRRVNNCGVSTQVVNNGDCQTVVTSANSYLRYSNDWNRVSKDYKARGIRLTAGSHELLTLQAIQRNRDYWKGDYDRSHSRVLSTHTTCSAPAPVVQNITYEAPPASYVAPAPATTVPAPVPAPVSTQLQAVPSGSANSGDGSTEK